MISEFRHEATLPKQLRQAEIVPTKFEFKSEWLWMETFVFLAILMIFHPFNFSGMSKPVDIFYVVDTSQDVQKSTINSMKAFLIQLSRVYNVSRNGARISVLSYGETSRVHLKLGQGTSMSALRQSLNSITETSGPRRLDKALALVRDNIVGLKDGVRKESARTVIVLTAGRNLPTVLQDLLSVSKDLRQLNVDVAAVGIGPNVDRSELRQIASSVDNAVSIPSLDRLDEAVAPLSATVQNAQKVSAKIDIGFVLGIDAQGEEQYFESGKAVIANIISKLDLSPGNTRLGLIAYGSDVRPILSFDRTYETISALKAIREHPVPPMEKGFEKSELARKLENNVQYLFSEQRGARKDAQNVLLAFVNNKLETPARLAIERVTERRGNVIIVYFGEKTDLKLLSDLLRNKENLIRAGRKPLTKKLVNDVISLALPGTVQGQFFLFSLLQSHWCALGRN